MTVSLVLLFLEGLLQVATRAFPQVDDLLSPEPRRIAPAVPDSLLGYRPNPDYAGHDARGFRNPKALGKADIVCLGDSQTYGAGVASQDAWPRILARRSGLDVYSMAFGGYGPTHSLLLLDDAVRLDPKLVIYAVYSGNDLYDSFDDVYNIGRLAELKTADPATATLLAQSESDDPIADRVVELFRMGVPAAPLNTAVEPVPLRHRIKIYMAYRNAKKRVRNVLERPRGADAIWEEAKRFASQHADYCEIFDDGASRTIFTPAYRLAAEDLSQPQIEEGLRISLAAIGMMHRRASVRGIEFLVLLIPTKEYVFRTTVRESTHRPSDAYRGLIANESVIWNRCTQFLEDAGIDFIDTSQALAASIAHGTSPYRSTADGHPNEHGHDIIARLVESWVSSTRGVGRLPHTQDSLQRAHE